MAPNLTSLRRGQWSRRQKWCHSQSQSGKLAPHANKGTWLDAVSLFIQYTNYILKRLVFLLEMTELTPNSQACWLFTVESDLLLKLCMSLSFKIGKLLLFFLNIHYDFLYKKYWRVALRTFGFDWNKTFVRQASRWLIQHQLKVYEWWGSL